MPVVIINPNSTPSMTAAMVETARRVAPGATFDGWTSHLGPPAIQGAADGARATPPLLDLVRQASSDGAEAIIIGCFDDTALAEAARIARCPVIGIGQVSYHLAALRNWRFSVVTTLPVSVPVLETNIHAFGFGRYLGRVRASDVAVLDLENDPGAAENRIIAEARRAEREDGVDALILGCAGMVNIARRVGGAVGLQVLDPVAVAAASTAWLTRPLSA